MLFYFSRGLGSRFQTVLDSFGHQADNPLLNALSQSGLERIAAEEGVDFGNHPDDIYTPSVTLWAWLTQVLSGSKSCVAAVARVVTLMAILERPIPSAGTGAYCKARAKLPEAFLRRLTVTVGAGLEDRAPDDWRWHGLRVNLVDGFAVDLPDTPANQKAYPQPSSQAAGLGYPLMRVVILLAFATAGVLDAACGPHQGKETGEPALFRQLLDSLRRRDVVVADRYYCSYWLVALLQERGVEVAFRLHQRRRYDFRRGQRVGAGDHVVRWFKPARPGWMDEATYAGLPEALTVREVLVTVTEPGRRTRKIVVATTLLDAAAYPQKDIADLYHQRWHAELDIRAIKQTLRMEHLTCKSPALARRELWAHLLGYNLVRQVMAAAAREAGRSPRQVSLAGALQTLEAFRWLLIGQGPVGGNGSAFVAILLLAVGAHEVGNRPDRVEPREVKRRPRNYPRLKKARDQRRRELLAT